MGWAEPVAQVGLGTCTLPPPNQEAPSWFMGLLCDPGQVTPPL